MALRGRTPPLSSPDALARIRRAGAVLVKRNPTNGRALYRAGQRYVVWIPYNDQVILEEHDSSCSCGV